MSDDIIKRLREAIAAPALHDEGASSDDTWQAVRKFRQLASPDNIAHLLDRLDRAERENEKLREDADRYRWLRGDEDGRYLTVYAFRTDVDEVCLGEELDATIDAARRKK